MNPYVKLDISDKIGTIEFYHPQSNSLPSIILKKLADMIYSAGQKEEISVIVLKSGGDRTFCAGASFDELMKIENANQGKDFFSGFAHVINASRKCPKLIIGRVQGKAVGGGVGMAASTDYCFATKFACWPACIVRKCIVCRITAELIVSASSSNSSNSSNRYLETGLSSGEIPNHS